jgi:nucleotide-binding universal stress UspA family protein
MFAKTLSSDRYSSMPYSGWTTQDSSRIARAKDHGENVDRAAGTHPPSINDLLVVVSASEPHWDVAMRAQLVAHETPVCRTVLLTPRSGKWQRFLQRISTLRSRFSEARTDASARVLRASLPAERTRVETCTPASVLEHARSSDLVVVGRRRTFPWSLVPLARYARRLLRRTRTPVLVVGSRPKGSYRGVVIATDLETDVGPALKWARHLAPHASFTFLHVYRGLFESKLQYADVSNADIAEYRLAGRQKAGRG